jgi:hypothetical protein
MDREGDFYALLAGITERQCEFVVRSFQDRVLVGHDEDRLRDVARTARASLRREVPLSPRPHIRGPKGERHPARRFRTAKLSIAALAVELPRTIESGKTGPATIQLNVIHVREKKPPVGEPPVEWFLLTNLPIDTPEAIASPSIAIERVGLSKSSSRRSRPAANTREGSSKPPQAY